MLPGRHVVVASKVLLCFRISFGRLQRACFLNRIQLHSCVVAAANQQPCARIMSLAPDDLAARALRPHVLHLRECDGGSDARVLLEFDGRMSLELLGNEDEDRLSLLFLQQVRCG
jgi:hypothetical protein